MKFPVFVKTEIRLDFVFSKIIHYFIFGINEKKPVIPVIIVG